jgi:HK97 gp10 family phage protein
MASDKQSLSVQVVGGAELEAALRRLLAEVPQLANNLLDDSAMRVEAAAKQRCPVDTGRLRSSIQVASGKGWRTVSTNVEYAPYVEFGTRRRGAKPFMFPAAEAERPRFQAAVQAALAKLGAS